MLSVSTAYTNAIKAKVRRIKAKAELYSGNALAATFTQNDRIASIEIQRVGVDSKFFGFGVSHKVSIKLIDVKRELNLSTSDYFKINLGIELPDKTIEYKSFPKMYITEVNRDENTNELSITAYDVLNRTTAHTVSELALEGEYTIREFITAVGAFLGVSVSIPADLTAFDLSYTEGANFEGTETLQDALVAAAEATQTIYSISGEDVLTFKRLDKSGNAAKTISREEYLTLDSSTNRRLQTICHATELGDNVSASTSLVGTTQYVRDNPFWDLRDDIGELVEAAVAAIGDISINQFNCEWRGDFALEPGDKIAFITKDNKTAISYLLNDTITYDGSLHQKTEWNYTDSDESESNPASLGDALKQTYARVDKANKQIELLVSETSSNSNAIATLQMNTESINASVSKIEQNTSETLESINSDLATLSNTVEAKMSSEEVSIAIKNELANGVDKVITSTGFTFDDKGLTVSKTGSEMTTNIDEDGMSVYRDSEEVLTADNRGVIAYDLHAKTYLIVGENSRFEDYEKDGQSRTGCFWIGETEVE